MKNNKVISLGNTKTELLVSDLAELFQVHPDTIRRWDKKGILKGQRHPFNNYRIYSFDDLKGLLENAEFKQSSTLRKSFFERARTRGFFNPCPEEAFKSVFDR